MMVFLGPSFLDCGGGKSKATKEGLSFLLVG